MIRNLDPSAERFLLDLRRIQQTVVRTGHEISSGLRVTNASDAPDQISDILQLCTDIEQNAQIRTNLQRVQSETDTAESAIAAAVRIMDRARVLASQGAGSVQTAETRRTLAEEAGSLLEQIVAASRTIVDGRYVFSGDRDQEPAYEINLANPNGADRLAAVAATREVQHPSGTSFTVARTAQDIFDSRNPDDTLAPENAFAAINSLRTALENNDQAGIDASLASLRLAGNHLNIELSHYGTVQAKILEAIDTSHQLDVRLRTELSSRRDADLTAAALELQQSQSHQEAALAARAQLPQSSLFDFLK